MRSSLRKPSGSIRPGASPRPPVPGRERSGRIGHSSQYQSGATSNMERHGFRSGALFVSRYHLRIAERVRLVSEAWAGKTPPRAGRQSRWCWKDSRSARAPHRELEAIKPSCASGSAAIAPVADASLLAERTPPREEPRDAGLREAAIFATGIGSPASRPRPRQSRDARSSIRCVERDHEPAQWLEFDH